MSSLLTRYLHHSSWLMSKSPGAKQSSWLRGKHQNSGGYDDVDETCSAPASCFSLRAADLAAPKLNGARRHQVHFWLTLNDYQFLQSLARQEEEPMSRIIRRLIRTLRQQADGRLFIAAAAKPALTSSSDPSRKSA